MFVGELRFAIKQNRRGIKLMSVFSRTLLALGAILIGVPGTVQQLQAGELDTINANGSMRIVMNGARDTLIGACIRSHDCIVLVSD
jgi:hypothetical protein